MNVELTGITCPEDAGPFPAIEVAVSVTGATPSTPVLTACYLYAYLGNDMLLGRRVQEWNLGGGSWWVDAGLRADASITIDENGEGTGTATLTVPVAWPFSSAIEVYADLKNGVTNRSTELVGPTVTVTIDPPSAPSIAIGTVDTADPAPEIPATISALTLAWQGSGYLAGGTWQLALFRTADVAREGFDATRFHAVARSTGRWSVPYTDGETPGEVAASLTCPVLDNAVSYTVYARAGRVTQSGGSDWCSWVPHAFTTAFPSLSAPSMQVQQGLPVTFLVHPTEGAYDPAHSSVRYSLLRSADAGATFTPVRGQTDVDYPAWADGAPFPDLALVDTLPPRGVALVYHIIASSVYEGVRVGSPPAVAYVSAIDAASRWRFTMPAGSWLEPIVTGPTPLEVKEEVTLQHPQGRDNPVALTTGGLSREGSLTIHAIGVDEIAFCDSVCELTVPLFVDSPWGWSSWARVLTRPTTPKGTATAPRREYALAYVLVDEPV